MSNSADPLPLPEPDPVEPGPGADILFRGHAGWLRSLLQRRFGTEAAEELVQDTWVRVLASGRVSEIRSPRAFLWRVASRLALDRARRSARRPRPTAWREDAGPGVAGEQAERLLLKQVILDLPDPLREVFLLSRVGGLTYESIARHLNISVKTVEWRMSRALARCAERLDD
ncbi:RNA polymerase sigma factor [Brevundimonas fluminis]|uniref:RNA polymerase sigma factor n=1 Tax=Brevundimonas fluminis TaxID=2487274 RepID=UPI0013DDDA73|nr:RNA polymerase sigma factor [Brevundimonas fluminis]